MTVPLLLLLFALLGAAIVGDLRRRLIPNRLNAAVALLAMPWWWACGLGPWAAAGQVALALAVLVLFAGLFALGAMGGGDVKLIAALALWLPWPLLFATLWWMSLAGGAVTLAAWGWHRWRRAAGPIEVPYGVAIAGAAVPVMANHFLTTLGA